MARHLADVPKLDTRGLQLLWVHDYYDGLLSSALVLRGKIHWFECCSLAADHRRRYVVHQLSDTEVQEEERWRALFVEHVGDHLTFKEEDEPPGTVRPGSEHGKFYDEYSNRAPVDYSRNPIVGWFEL
jgi:hypothetical protein